MASERPWEAEVEGFFHRLRPPGRRENVLRLGVDDTGDIVSAVAVQHVNPRSKTEIPFYFVNAMAVALRVRGEGGTVADAALEDTIFEVAKRVRVAGRDRFSLAGRIHRKNMASQAMATRNGMEPEDGDDQDPYLLWSMPVNIS